MATHCSDLLWDLYSDTPALMDLGATDVAREYCAHCFKAACPFKYLFYPEEDVTTAVANAARLGVGLWAVCADVVESLNAILKQAYNDHTARARGSGWVGLGEGLAWSPTHGPRRLPCRTRLGGCTRVSGHKAYRTINRPQTPRWLSRARDAAVPVCMCPCASEMGGGGCGTPVCSIVVRRWRTWRGQVCAWCWRPRQGGWRASLCALGGRCGPGFATSTSQGHATQPLHNCLLAREGGGTWHDWGLTRTP